jgi:hypothetical protein
MSGKLVYPVGLLVMGKQVIQRPLERAKPWEPEGTAPGVESEVRPFGFSLTRFMPAKWLEPFVMMLDNPCKVESIVVLGPGLLERVTYLGQMLYDRNQSHDEDGRLFFAPYRVINSGQQLVMSVRCQPALFMLDGPHPETVDSELETLEDPNPRWPDEVT